MRQKKGADRLPDHGALKKERNKNTKLLGQGLRTGATQAVSGKSLVRYARFILMQVITKTITNHRSVTKA